jgi:hypothetical protein
MLGWQQAPELLLDQVPDHALGAGVEDVKRIRFGTLVGLRLQGEQPYLRPVAVDDHDAVLAGERGDGLSRDPHVAPLHRSGHRFRTP